MVQPYHEKDICNTPTFFPRIGKGFGAQSKESVGDLTPQRLLADNQNYGIMKDTKVTIEKNPDGTFSAYMEEIFPDFGLAGYGDTAKEAVDDFYAAYEDTKDFLRQNGKEIPELSFSFTYDLQSFFSYFSFLNISKIGERAGISPSLMRQYVAGSAKASQRQYDKIRQAIRQISLELNTASI